MEIQRLLDEGISEREDCGADLVIGPSKRLALLEVPDLLERVPVHECALPRYRRGRPRDLPHPFEVQADAADERPAFVAGHESAQPVEAGDGEPIPPPLTDYG